MSWTRDSTEFKYQSLSDLSIKIRNGEISPPKVQVRLWPQHMCFRNRFIPKSKIIRNVLPWSNSLNWQKLALTFPDKHYQLTPRAKGQVPRSWIAFQFWYLKKIQWDGGGLKEALRRSSPALHQWRVSNVRPANTAVVVKKPSQQLHFLSVLLRKWPWCRAAGSLLLSHYKVWWPAASLCATRLFSC